jgi:UDP-glucose 4-epimerase
MEKHNCKNLVFSSSATVYGTPKTIPIPETSPLQPESAYGRTKAMVEQILKDVCVASAGKESKDAAFKGVSVRYFKWVDAVCYVISPQSLGFGGRDSVAAIWRDRPPC